MAPARRSSSRWRHSAALFPIGSTQCVLAKHADGSLIGPPSLYPGATTPARPGETIVMVGDGFGPTNPPFPDGQIPDQIGALPTLPVITIGGVQAQVTFAGLVSPGLYQFNVVVPPSLSNRDAAVVAQYGGASTESGVYLSVARN